VDDEHDVAGESERLEPGVEIACVVDESIAPARRLARFAHAHQIRSQAAALPSTWGMMLRHR
jgi:hypothetical protein